MVRGITTFKCTQCGKTFEGWDAEWRATVFTCPLPCPKCGSIRTRPPLHFPWSFLDRFGWGGNGGYETIWELMEKEQKEGAATDDQEESQAVE